MTSRERSPLDNTYLRGLLWNERVNLVIAVVCAVLCTCSNLAAPVISGYLFEVLAGRQPAALYPKVAPPATSVHSQFVELV